MNEPPKKRRPSIEFVVACVVLAMGAVLTLLWTWLYPLLAAGRGE